MLRFCTFSCTCTHRSCYASVRSDALAYIGRATLLYVLMHLHTYVMRRCCTFSCTCTHTSCYAAVRSHALAHIRHATLLYVLMHLHTYVMLRCCTSSCTCTHTSCYAAVRCAISRMINILMMMMVMWWWWRWWCDDDDDGDDDDYEIATDAKVSFFSVLWSPPVKCLKSDNSEGPLKCPAPCFSYMYGSIKFINIGSAIHCSYSI